MKYETFCAILDKHIFEGEKQELLRRIATRPERFIGLFRPTSPGAKVLQHILHSHEIRFGDAIEEITTGFLQDWGFRVLEKKVVPNPTGRKKLYIDQYFTDGQLYYFIEQKLRDDHDSTKKRGQIRNFQAKLQFLYERHRRGLRGIMYFIDPSLVKNKNYYLEELQGMEKTYGVPLALLYGRELFEYFERPDSWDAMVRWLKSWRDGLGELPEVDLDNRPEEGCDQIKDLEIGLWKKILENDRLWEEGVIKAICKEGRALECVLDFFSAQQRGPYELLAELLRERLARHYGIKG